MKNIWISIVDDHSLFTRSLETLLDNEKGFSVVFTASDGVDFFKKLNGTKKIPDVVLMDLQMPNMDGFEATKRLKKSYPNIKVIIITMHDNEAFFLSMMSSGVEGYLYKNANPSELIKAIRSVYEGGVHFNQETLSTVSKKYANQKTSKKGFANNNISISNREYDVLELLCEAKTAKEIGEELHISERTVETHRNNLISKTNSRNIIQLVLYAVYNNIVETGKKYISNSAKPRI